MRCHVILNGNSPEYEKQCKEINAFINNNCSFMNKGNTYIIYEGKRDGDDSNQLADLAPTSSVIFIYMEKFCQEPVLDLLEDIIKESGVYIFGNQYSEEAMAVRLAARKDGISIVNVIELKEQKEYMFFSKMVYSGHMKATYKALKNNICCISIGKGIDEQKIQKGPREIIARYQCESGKWKTYFLDVVESKVEKKEGMETARYLVVGGRGIGNQENSLRLRQQAEGIGACYGVSRPVAMNAWAPMEELVGVSGNMVHPEVCITVGVSGAPAMYSGIEKSRFIISINTDERAPIIKKSDVAIIEDYKKIMEYLTELFQEGEEQ